MYEVRIYHSILKTDGTPEKIMLKWSFEAILINTNARWINGYNTLKNGVLKTTTFKLDDDFYIEVYDHHGTKIMYGGNHNDLCGYNVQA